MEAKFEDKDLLVSNTVIVSVLTAALGYALVRIIYSGARLYAQFRKQFWLALVVSDASVGSNPSILRPTWAQFGAGGVAVATLMILLSPLLSFLASSGANFVIDTVKLSEPYSGTERVNRSVETMGGYQASMQVNLTGDTRSLTFSVTEQVGSDLNLGFMRCMAVGECPSFDWSSLTSEGGIRGWQKTSPCGDLSVPRTPFNLTFGEANLTNNIDTGFEQNLILDLSSFTIRVPIGLGGAWRADPATNMSLDEGMEGGSQFVLENFSFAEAQVSLPGNVMICTQDEDSGAQPRCGPGIYLKDTSDLYVSDLLLASRRNLVDISDIEYTTAGGSTVEINHDMMVLAMSDDEPALNSTGAFREKISLKLAEVNLTTLYDRAVARAITILPLTSRKVIYEYASGDCNKITAKRCFYFVVLAVAMESSLPSKSDPSKYRTLRRIAIATLSAEVKEAPYDSGSRICPEPFYSFPGSWFNRVNPTDYDAARGSSGAAPSANDSSASGFTLVLDSTGRINQVDKVLVHGKPTSRTTFLSTSSTPWYYAFDFESWSEGEELIASGIYRDKITGATYDLDAVGVDLIMAAYDVKVEARVMKTWIRIPFLFLVIVAGICLLALVAEVLSRAHVPLLYQRSMYELLCLMAKQEGPIHIYNDNDMKNQETDNKHKRSEPKVEAMAWELVGRTNVTGRGNDVYLSPVGMDEVVTMQQIPIGPIDRPGTTLSEIAKRSESNGADATDEQATLPEHLRYCKNYHVILSPSLEP